MHERFDLMNGSGMVISPLPIYTYTDTHTYSTRGIWTKDISSVLFYLTFGVNTILCYTLKGKLCNFNAFDFGE